MLALIRGLLYGSLFVGLALVLLPASVLRFSGVSRPAVGLAQGAGTGLVLLGSAVAVPPGTGHTDRGAKRPCRGGSR